MGKRVEQGFSWGPGNIPGRRIALEPGDCIVVYNSNGMPNITGRDLITEKPFVIPQTWKDEAREFVESLKKPQQKQKTKEVTVFDANKNITVPKELAEL
jgi:hypothetical protein